MNIREEQMSEFFTKYHIEGLPFPAVLHKFTAPDEGDPHDHPFSFTTHIIKGGYFEEVYYLDFTKRTIFHGVKINSTYHVNYDRIHKIIELPYGETWSLIMPEAWVKQPCFYRFENNKIFVRQWNETNLKPLI